MWAEQNLQLWQFLAITGKEETLLNLQEASLRQEAESAKSNQKLGKLSHLRERTILTKQYFLLLNMVKLSNTWNG